MAVYDSAKIREIAKLMKRMADRVSVDVRSNIRNASEIPESIRGRTAQVIEEKLEMLIRNAAGIEEEILELAHVTDTYADLLERADAQLAEEL